MCLIQPVSAYRRPSIHYPLHHNTHHKYHPPKPHAQTGTSLPSLTPLVTVFPVFLIFSSTVSYASPSSAYTSAVCDSRETS